MSQWSLTGGMEVIRDGRSVCLKGAAKQIFGFSPLILRRNPGSRLITRNHLPPTAYSKGQKPHPRDNETDTTQFIPASFSERTRFCVCLFFCFLTPRV